MLFLLCHIASLNAKLTNVNEENGRMIVTCLKHIGFRTLKIDSLNCNIIIGNGLYGYFFFITVFGTKRSKVFHSIFI